MGRKIPEEATNYLKSMLERMKLKINEEKSSMLNGYKESFDFLGFAFRYSKDLYRPDRRYWNGILNRVQNHRRDCEAKSESISKRMGIKLLKY